MARYKRKKKYAGKSKRKRVAWWSKPRRKLSKREKRARSRARSRSYNRRLKQRRNYEKRRAAKAGLSHREYVHRRAVRERAHRTKIDHLFKTGGRGAVFRYLIERGNLDTRDPVILSEAGISHAQAEQITNEQIRRGLKGTMK
jgi:hypothetical protein